MSSSHNRSQRGGGVCVCSTPLTPQCLIEMVTDNHGKGGVLRNTGRWSLCEWRGAVDGHQPSEQGEPSPSVCTSSERKPTGKSTSGDGAEERKRTVPMSYRCLVTSEYSHRKCNICQSEHCPALQLKNWGTLKVWCLRNAKEQL